MRRDPSFPVNPIARRFRRTILVFLKRAPFKYLSTFLGQSPTLEVCMHVFHHRPSQKQASRINTQKMCGLSGLDLIQFDVLISVQM